MRSQGKNLPPSPQPSAKLKRQTWRILTHEQKSLKEPVLGRLTETVIDKLLEAECGQV